MAKKRTVVKRTTSNGTKIKSVESRSGNRLKETAKNKAAGTKSKQKSKNGVIKKTVSKYPGGKTKEVEIGKRRKVVNKSRI